MTISENRDDMQIDWDCEIEMDDDLILRADVFRPLLVLAVLTVPIRLSMSWSISGI